MAELGVDAAAASRLLAWSAVLALPGIAVVVWLYHRWSSVRALVLFIALRFVGGVRGTGELARLVDSGAAAVAFAMPATSVDDLVALADAGLIMPPKSTWFEPKLRSGLFVHRFSG